MRNSIKERKDGRWYARYRKGTDADGKPVVGYIYGQTKEAVEERLNEMGISSERVSHSESSLNLLILGAGTHGKDVKEIAESLHIFRKIRFLDDKIGGSGIYGRCDEAHEFRREFPCAFVAIGDNEVRKKYMSYLREHHFLLPSIVAPSAVISPNAEIGEGTVIMQQANVGAAEIGDFCIIAQGSMIGSESVVGSYSLVDSGAIVLRGANIPEGSYLASGETYNELVKEA